jgi:hypothetical protein
MRFADRIVELDRSLTAGNVLHGFGGAIALAAAVDEPRATVDVDINVAGDAANPESVLRALPAGVRWKPSDIRTIRKDGQIRLWWEDTPVDLFFPQHDFHELVASRYRMLPFEGTTIPVLSPTDLVIFKALFNRTKDWADIEAILRAGSADVEEALTWIAQIAGESGPSYQRLAELAASGPPDEPPPRWR